jgi:hypothetical protein
MSSINVPRAVVLLVCVVLSAQGQPSRSLRGSTLTPSSIPCPQGKCCTVIYNGDSGDKCDAVPVWDVTAWTNPGGSFVQASTLCGKVLHNWQSKAKSNAAFNPEDNSLTMLPGNAHKVGSYVDPLCSPTAADDVSDNVSAKFFAYPGVGLDFSVSTVSDEPEIGEAIASSAECHLHRTGERRPSGSKLECALIPAGEASNKVKGRWCTCKSGKWEVGQLISETETPATTLPPNTSPESSTGSDKRQQLAKLMPEVIANAKMLCTIVDAIDCWQENVDAKEPKKDTPSWWERFGSFMGSKAESKSMATIGVPVTSHRGDATEAKFVANPSEMLEKMRSVCKVIDRGVDSLPEIIDEFVKPVLSNLIKDKLGDRLAGKIGGSILDKLLTKENLDFGDMFSVDTHNESEASIQLAGEARRIGVVRAA